MIAISLGFDQLIAWCSQQSDRDEADRGIRALNIKNEKMDDSFIT